MNAELISKKDESINTIIDKVKLALIGKPNANKASIILKEYYTKNKAVFDINEVLPLMENFTPLCMACWYGFYEGVDFLLNNDANPNLTLDNIAIPLHLAAEQGFPLIVKSLLRKGAEIDKLSTTNQTAFMRACESPNQQRSKEVINVLFNNGMSIVPDLNKKSNTMQSPLDYALEKGNYDTIRAIEYYKLQRTTPNKSTEGNRRSKI